MKFLKIIITTIYFLMFSNAIASQKIETDFTARVAIVDVQNILEHSTAVQGIRKSIEAISQDIQQKMSKKELELKKDEEALIKKRGILDEAAFEKEAGIFNQKVSNAQKEVQAMKAKLEHSHSEAINKVHEVTISIISDLAKKYNFTLALPSSQVLFSTHSINITPEVLQLLNEKLKTVQVDYK